MVGQKMLMLSVGVNVGMSFVGMISGSGSPNYLDRSKGLFVDYPYVYVTCDYGNSLNIFDVSLYT